MPTLDDSTWIEARIARTEVLIIGYEDGILELSTGAQTYMLDTGQTRQSVTKANLSSMRIALDMLENRRATLRARLCGAGTFIGRPFT